MTRDQEEDPEYPKRYEQKEDSIEKDLVHVGQLAVTVE